MSGADETKSTSTLLPAVAVSADAHATPTASGPAVMIEMAAQALQFSVSLGFALLLAAVVCFGLVSTASQFSRSARSSRHAVQESSLRSLIDRLKITSQESQQGPQRNQFVRDIEAATRQFNLQSLGALTSQTRDLVNVYNEAYEVHVVDKTEELRGFTRDEPDETGVPVRACYLIVEARDPSGQPVSHPVRITTAAGGATAIRWAERVPEEVYERIISFRAEDNGDDQTLFAVKERGQPALQIRMTGVDGQPLNRQATLTEW